VSLVRGFVVSCIREYIIGIVLDFVFQFAIKKYTD